ncbi:hypothetical protein [Pseudoduganella buxea]|uniref:Uncharacterized protein n=1 Tax=Pseudoduganella buxea TaxID=1949069 RepID=A0A6I3T0V6_9BURK|nr:hypothetical protein [Pseudoduganella buxea]MTV54934.1 hypothetical protein [Pseudoduganella buxea]GGC23688.1 hypothetical protein GCM10011572_51520 [Pseudoduganella buxea]
MEQNDDNDEYGYDPEMGGGFDPVGFYASQEEWDALTDQQREAQWESFYERNAAGTADEMRFYKVMMAQYLLGYVGD